MTAFNYELWQKWSQGDAVGCNNNWNYTDATSTLATLVAANYFDDVNNQNPSGILQINDVIYVVGSDGSEYCIVTAIDPHVTIAPFSINIPAGSIVNADVNAAAAIDYSKLAPLPSGQILVGSAGNVATAVPMTGEVTIANTGATVISANAVDSGALALNTIQYVKVPMTAAQWNGMYGAPFIMIAAPGAGNMIVVRGAVLAMTFVSANFAVGGNVALQYDSTIQGAGPLASATVAAATVNAYGASSDVGVAGADTSGASSTKVNKGLYLSNDTAAFTTGDGTWNIHIWYEIVTL